MKVETQKLKPRHILIIADIEGSSGCGDYTASSFMTAGWAAACLEMTRDVNTVATTLLDAGVARVTVADFHRTGYNLIRRQLDPRARLIQGYRRGPVPGLGSPHGVAGVLFVGMHAASGTDGFLAHTLTSRIASLCVNGRPLAEVELFAASLAPYGVRPLFFSGCPTACRQAARALPGMRTYPIEKQADGRLQNLQQWRQGLAREALGALTMQNAPPPYRPRGPLYAEIRFRDGEQAARQIQHRWHLKRAGNTILLKTQTLDELYRELIKICYLSPLAEKILPIGLPLYRFIGLAGIAWVAARLKTA